jgi:hypothetical protein
MDTLQIALLVLSLVASISPLISLILPLRGRSNDTLRIIVYDTKNRISVISINLSEEPTKEEIDRFVDAIPV